MRIYSLLTLLVLVLVLLVKALAPTPASHRNSLGTASPPVLPRRAATPGAGPPPSSIHTPKAALKPTNSNTAAHSGGIGIEQNKPSGNTYPRPDSIGGKPVGFYLTNPKVSPLAKALYTAHFRPSDNDSTTQLLALVTTNDGQIRPFYRWCLDFTIAIADGALGEYPGEPALAYATKFPREFFAYMDKDATGARYRRWVEIIAYSGLSNYEASEPATRKAITKAMTKQCMACANQTVDRINTFAQDVATSAQRNTQ